MTPPENAAVSTDYARILDLIARVESCVQTVYHALPDRTLDSNLRARNYAAQIEVDVRELQTLLLDRHLLIQEQEAWQEHGRERIEQMAAERSAPVEQRRLRFDLWPQTGRFETEPTR